MKTKIVLIMVMILFCPLSFATPPGDLNLTYDLEKGTLTAIGPHPTQDLTVHYIRRMEVSKNGGAPVMFYFTRQNSAAEFNETVPLEMKPNDMIHVKVYCSEGGAKEADLKIPEGKSEPVSTNLKAIKDKEHKNMQIIP